MTDYLLHVVTGMLLCNCIPHLSAGLQGDAFPTPFARLVGKLDSPAPVNVLWGLANLVVGLRLFAAYPVAFDANPHAAALVGGAILLGVPLSIAFARVRHRRAGFATK